MGKPDQQHDAGTLSPAQPTIVVVQEPLLLERRRRMIVAPMALAAVIGFAYIMAPLAGNRSAIIGYVLSAVILMTLLGVLGCVMANDHRFLRKLKACEYRCCTRCGYDLSGSTSSSAAAAVVVCCPECGKELDLKQAQALWRQFRPLLWIVRWEYSISTTPTAAASLSPSPSASSQQPAAGDEQPGSRCAHRPTRR